MSMIDKVAELRKQEEAARGDVWSLGKRYPLGEALCDAAPDMLSILSEIRAGDTKILQRVITIFNQSAWEGEYQAEVGCLKRYQVMAAKMTEESK
jgi:hypothetical protein